MSDAETSPHWEIPFKSYDNIKFYKNPLILWNSRLCDLNRTTPDAQQHRFIQWRLIFVSPMVDMYIPCCSWATLVSRRLRVLGQNSLLTHSERVSMALVVNAEFPEALIGKVSRVAILHPVVSCCGNDEEHESGKATQRAPSCQCVEHGGRAQDRVLTHSEKTHTILLQAGRTDE